MSNDDFEKLVRKAILYYAIGAPEYQEVRNDITIEADQHQWELFVSRLNESGEFLFESAAGTLRQKEAFLARREGRPSRYPSDYAPEEERRQKLAALAADFMVKCMRYRPV